MEGISSLYKISCSKMVKRIETRKDWKLILYISDRLDFEMMSDILICDKKVFKMYVDLIYYEIFTFMWFKNIF